MDKVKREFDISALFEQNSFFLLGPRATGKSTLLRQWISEQVNGSVLYVDLLQSNTTWKLKANPAELGQMVLPHHKVVVIDEVQKIPELLDAVHSLIETKGIKFILTGSSARKIRKTHANLLGGRAWPAEMYPFVAAEREQSKTFDLNRILRYGNLPRVFLSRNPEEDLNAYITLYLKDEIEHEGWVKSIPSFARFLRSAALSAGALLNYTQIASDAGVSAVTVKEHYSILQQTLLGHVLEPFTETHRRKAIQTGKFYYFDTGVLNALLEVEHLDRNTDNFGKCLEHLIHHELRSYLSYRRIRKSLTFWQSVGKKEVDFLVGKELAIEVKASKSVHPRFLESLNLLEEEGIFKNFILITTDPVERKIGSVQCMPVELFLERLWNDELIGSGPQSA